MRIRFKTKDNIVTIRECPHISEPPLCIDRPIRSTEGRTMGFRRYEYRGEIQNSIPTVHEC